MGNSLLEWKCCSLWNSAIVFKVNSTTKAEEVIWHAFTGSLNPAALDP